MDYKFVCRHRAKEAFVNYRDLIVNFIECIDDLECPLTLDKITGE